MNGVALLPADALAAPAAGLAAVPGATTPDFAVLLAGMVAPVAADVSVAMPEAGPASAPLPDSEPDETQPPDPEAAAGIAPLLPLLAPPVPPAWAGPVHIVEPIDAAPADAVVGASEPLDPAGSRFGEGPATIGRSRESLNLAASRTWKVLPDKLPNAGAPGTDRPEARVLAALRPLAGTDAREMPTGRRDAAQPGEPESTAASQPTPSEVSKPAAPAGTVQPSASLIAAVPPALRDGPLLPAMTAEPTAATAPPAARDNAPATPASTVSVTAPPPASSTVPAAPAVHRTGSAIEPTAPARRPVVQVAPARPVRPTGAREAMLPEPAPPAPPPTSTGTFQPEAAMPARSVSAAPPIVAPEPAPPLAASVTGDPGGAIDLATERLGAVRVAVSARETHVAVQFTAETPAAAGLLAGQSARLGDAVAAAGHRFGGVAVDVGGGGAAPRQNPEHRDAPPRPPVNRPPRAAGIHRVA